MRGNGSKPGPGPASRQGGRVLRASLARSLDVALPRLCPSCRDPVDDTGLCPPAGARSPSSHRPIARGSAFRSLRRRPRHLVDAGDRRSAGVHRARAAVRYDDIARTLVHALKYGDRLDLAPTHGTLDGDAGARTARRRRRARAGAAALAAAVDAALQPVGAARRRSSRKAASGRAMVRSSASRRRRSRSGCRQVRTGRATSRARSAYPPRARPRWPGAG